MVVLTPLLKPLSTLLMFFCIAVGAIDKAAAIEVVRVSASLCKELFIFPAWQKPNLNIRDLFEFQSFIFSPIIEFHDSGRVIRDIADSYVLHSKYSFSAAELGSRTMSEETLRGSVNPMGGYLEFPTDGRSLSGVKKDLHDLLLGLNAIHDAYGDRMTEAEKLLTRNKDWGAFDLINERIGYAVVKQNRQVIGLAKIYDGTAYPKSEDKFLSVKAMMKPTLPLEEILSQRKITTDIIDFYRKQNYNVFELGKYFLNTNLDSKSMIKIRVEISKWLLRNYLASDRLLYEKSVFFIDAVSKIHERAYKKIFGATVVAPERFNQPLPEGNVIMQVDGTTLKALILKFLREQGAAI